jgi:hypothetical protein
METGSSLPTNFWRANQDGSFIIQFGGVPNYLNLLPIIEGRDYVARLLRTPENAGRESELGGGDRKN